ncbi:MAG: FAD-dependent oxidoreductase [Pseudomonadota bacterium]
MPLDSSRDPRYDCLFEPIKLGPVTARNRFYQVPHCNGMGHVYPASMAEMRGVKAEGGWAVISTEEVEIHHTTEIAPSIEGRLWDAQDIPYHARMVEKVQQHGSLAAIELVYHGHTTSNRYSRIPPMAAHSIPTDGIDPVQTRAMDKADFKALRRWHRNAALNAKAAGYDIVYVYAGHNLCLTQHLIAKRFNQRTDEYGGSLENRVRLFRELIEDTKEAVGDRCAVAVRFAVDELMGPEGITSETEGREVVEMLAELPDLWDVNVSDWANDSVTARFAEEGYQEPYIRFVKGLTSKPVVGVGRYTSADAMVSLIKRGVLDMIGAARPSIADPFLPKKIEEGRMEDIRECIGCNICVTGDYMYVPMRCTQNPTVGEEWRREWHPERIAKAKTEGESVLIVGAGPAGLEAARAAAARGYQVMLAEAERDLGGRVTRESRLPGLSSYARVRDYRQGQLEKMEGVEIFRESRLTLENILEVAPDHLAIATGASWRRDGAGRALPLGLPGLAENPTVFTPDDLMAGALPEGPVLVFDDDHYYLASVLTDLLVAKERPVIFVTPQSVVAPFTEKTMEQHRIVKRMMDAGVEIKTAQSLTAFDAGRATLTCGYSGRETLVEAASLLLVTARSPNDALLQEAKAAPEKLEAAGIRSLRGIGDCVAPGTVAAAVYEGHLWARDLGEVIDPDVAPFLREERALPAD